MSALLFNNLQTSLHFLHLAKASEQEKNLAKSLVFLKIAHSFNPNNPILLYSIARTLHYLENDLEALHWTQKALGIAEKLPLDSMNETVKMNIIALQLQLLENLHPSVDLVCSTLSKFEEEVQRAEFLNPETKEALQSRINHHKNEFSQKEKTIKIFSLQERKIQAREVFDMMKTTIDLASCFKAKVPLYIISMKWFSKWKKYTYFHHLVGDYNDKTESLTSENTEIIDDLTSDEEGESEELFHSHPGNIDQSDILESESDIFLDPESESNFGNEVLKKGLQENKDYLIVDGKVWHYLSRLYQGREIRRYVINVNDKDYFLLELWLKKIKFFIWPNIAGLNVEALIPNNIYLSKRDSVKVLKEKIQRVMGYFPLGMHLKDKEARVWKNFDFETYLHGKFLFEEQAKIPIKNGVILEESSTLEEAEICEDENLLIEFKFFQLWTFFHERNASKANTDSQVLNPPKSCNHCKNTVGNLLRCSCSQVFYCNQECQRANWRSHMEICKKTRALQEQPQKQQSQLVSVINPEQLFRKSSRKGLSGLQNIGNTCFMNSGLQCLSNVYILTKFFLSRAYMNEINEKNVLGTGGRLARSYANLLEEVWVDDKPHASTWEIKKIIAKLAPQFYGYNQQDSQEFISYLLDGLHEDLNRVKEKPFVENKDSDETRPEEEVSQESWQNYLKRNQSIIVDYFAGQYKSTLVCPDCNKISITYDPFLIASLPIPAMDYTEINIYFIFRDQKQTPIKMKLNLFSFITVETLIQRVSNYLKLDERFLEMCWIKDHLICEFVDKHSLIRKFKDCEGLLFMFEKFKPTPQLVFDEKNFVKTEVQVFHKSSRNQLDASCKVVSYTRLFLLHLNWTLSQIHLEVYRLFRRNIKILYKNSSKYANFHNFFAKFDFSSDEEEEKNPNLVNIEKEYKEIFLFDKKELSAPYTLFIFLKKNDKKPVLEPLTFDGNLLRSIVKDCLFPEHLKIQIRWEFCVKIEDLKLSVCTVDNDHKNINEITKKAFTLQECFDLFTREEKLDKDNEWYCNRCKAHKQATKKMELYKLPEILILHFKRFKTSRIGSIGSLYFPAGSTKINSFIDFPVSELEMKPFCRRKDEKTKYELIGISNHYGEMNGGHYTAFCRNEFEGKWFEFDDTTVTTCRNENELVGKAAYMLFYKKIHE